MKTILTLSCLLLLNATAFAQTAITTSEDTSVTDENRTFRGTREFTIGGSGAFNKDADDSFGGVDFAFGSYLGPSFEILLRQSLNYANPDDADNAWNGWTRLAFDQHFGNGRMRPFLGINAGRIYGDAVRDTWTAGLETGAKFYVRPQTFIQLTAEYGWFFEHSDDATDRFDDGRWNWALGVGFNF